MRPMHYKFKNKNMDVTIVYPFYLSKTIMDKCKCNISKKITRAQ